MMQILMNIQKIYINHNNFKEIHMKLIEMIFRINETNINPVEAYLHTKYFYVIIMSF